jgi:hypothetical protein
MKSAAFIGSPFVIERRLEAGARFFQTPEQSPKRNYNRSQHGDAYFEKASSHCPPPRCWRSKACSTLGQWKRFRLPILTCGILPDARQLKSVRRLTGSRVKSCFSSRNFASPLAGAVRLSVMHGIYPPCIGEKMDKEKKKSP